MRAAVWYYTRSGNTEKLAGAIARGAGVSAAGVDSPLREQAEILFLGCSYYAFDVDEAVKRFVQENREKIGQIVCFGTSVMMKSIRKPVQKVAEAAGIPVSGNEFHCRGAFGPMHKGRPDEKDLRSAEDFARRVVRSWNKGEEA